MKNFIKELPKATIITICIYFVLILINALAGKKIDLNHLFTTLLYTMLYGYSLYFSNAYLFQYLDRVFIKERFSTKRIIIGALSSFIVTIVVIFLLRVFEDVVVEGRSFKAYLSEENPLNYVVSIVITFCVTVSLYAFHIYKSYKENQLKEQKVIAGTASAQFESLKNQIDPHFLFNSLNVLSSLIEENPDNAQKFTTSLSKIYRYVLEQKDKDLVSVQEELVFAKTYMNLLKMRFENSITFELPENYAYPEAKIVPLSLQLLLENTIKHNVVSEEKPLHIKIYNKNDFLVVENNLQKKETLQDRKGVGLQNIVSRYALLTKRKIVIENNSKVFAVQLPVLTTQVVQMETQNIYNENIAYEKAKQRVQKLKEFYSNLIAYCCVIPVLIIVNLKTSNFHWFWFPMLGWGFGLTFHAFETFGYGKKWEERKIKEILDKEINKNNNQWN